MTCEKCSSELNLISGKYQDYYYCNSCFFWKAEYLSTCCRNPDMKYVQKGVQLRMQCFNCGDMNSGAIKKSTVPDFNALPVANENKRENKWELHNEERTKFINWINEKRKSALKEGYDEYLNSEKWKSLRLKILERDKNICQACLINKATQVHHLTYERFTDECCFDLVSVCVPCHNKIHSK